MDRRKFIGSAVATTIAAASAPARAFGFGLGGLRGQGALGGITTPVTAFDYFISPTGSATNSGTSPSSPLDISVLSYTPTSGTRASWNSTLAGKRIGLIGDQGTYVLGTYFDQMKVNSGSANGGVLFCVPGGTPSTSTYIGSCNSSGVETPRLAVLDGHLGATAGQSSVTMGIAVEILNVTTGNPTTVIEFTNPGSTNPFSVNQQIYVDGPDLASLGFTIAGQQGSSGGVLYTITAVSSASPWTISVTATTTGTFTATGQNGIFWNYNPVLGGIIGQTSNGPNPGNWGYATVSGLTITGCNQQGVSWLPSSGLVNFRANGRITNITSGSSTVIEFEPRFVGTGSTSGSVLTISAVTSGILVAGDYITFDGTNKYQISGLGTGNGGTGTYNLATTPASALSGTVVSANLFASGQLVSVDDVSGSGTIPSINYATSGSAYTVSATGGTLTAPTVTLSVATTGTFTASGLPYICTGLPRCTVQDCEIYDLNSWAGGEPALVYSTSTKGLQIINCKLHDYNVNLIDTAGPSSDGYEGFYDWDSLVDQCTFYNGSGGVWHKSWMMGNSIIQRCYFDMLPVTYSFAVFEGAGQILGGLGQIVRNCIMTAGTCASLTTTDGQPVDQGYQQFYNNTLYQPANLGTFNYESGATVTIGCTIAGTQSTLPNLGTGQFYNNVCYNTAGGSAQTDSWGYLDFNGTGTATTPANPNMSIVDYNLYDLSSATAVAVFSNYQLQFAGTVTEYTQAQMGTYFGFDAGSVLGTPTFTGSQFGYQYPTTNFQLATGSNGKGAGRIGGVSGGAATDMGAWGGLINGQPITQIGCNF